MSRWHERDFEAEDEAAYPRGPARGGVMVGLARLGFVVGAVAVVAGLVWFGFRHSAEVTDEASLPLIKADPRPLKSRPTQPGGMEVPNQDKLVFDRLDPGAAPPMVERLLPPPEVPMARPVAPVTPPPADPAAKTASRTAIDTVMAPPPIPLKSGLPGEDAPAPAALPPAPPPAAAPAAKTPPVAKPPSASAAAPAAPAPATVAALPHPTPPAVKAPAAAKPPPAGSGPAVRIQVGAVPREADAQTKWKRLQARHRDLLGTLNLTVVRADLGEKGVYFRLQAGPVDEARGRAICDQLKSQNVGCQLARN